jgi:hypothetical protein
VALVGALTVSPVYAHHPHDVFDNENVVTLSGTVSSFGWMFPHSTLVLNVLEDSGESAAWTLEMGAPNQLERYGWTNRALIPGEEISVVIYPKRDGTHEGAVLAVEFPSGVLMVDEEYWEYVDKYRVRR